MLRIGTGYDVHRLAAGRKLILGGVEIPYELGLAGHSDADVLVHAIMDALTGALGLPDIGVLFPDTDRRYQDISSLVLLEKVVGRMKEKGYAMVNADSVIIAQKPRLSAFIPEMRQNIAAVCGVAAELIGVKATTTEGLDAVGEGKGIAASAVVLLSKN